MEYNFKGKVVLITGGSQGIGKETAKQFALRGGNVFLLDINEKNLNKALEEFRSEGLKVYGEKMDVTNSKEVEQLTEKVVVQFGKIDILVNNAGIIRDNLLFKMSDEDWESVLDVHLKGTFNMTRAVQKHMVKNHFGRIINVSSISAFGNVGQANYATAKAGLFGFTRTAALELGKFGITVNAVAPGYINTQMIEMTAERIGINLNEFIEESIKHIPVKRFGEPIDVANAILFFASDQSSFITGQTLLVSGGAM